RTPGVSCSPPRAQDWLSAQVDLAGARPREAEELVPRPAREKRAGAHAEGLREGERRRRGLPVSLLAQVAGGDLRRRRRGAANRVRARCTRWLLHLLLQRLARQP